MIIERYRRSLIITAAVVAVYAMAGFFLAPWLIKTQAIKAVQASTGAELRLERVALNPFVLSLTINGLELDDPTGQPFASIDEIFVNFQLSSLFRWAWTFDELRLDGPQLHFARDAEGGMNLTRFASNKPAPEPEVGKEDKPASMPRLLVFKLVLNDGVFLWDDQAPEEPVDTRFGPISVAVNEFSTLPSTSGEQSVTITTEATGTLSWSGSLQLNPLQSSGRASIDGSHFPVISAYLRQVIGFDVTEGDADAEFDYQLSALPDEGFRASVDNFNLALHNVKVMTYTDAEDREVLTLPRVAVASGRFSWPERSVGLDSFAIDDAVVSALRDEAGRLNLVPRTKDADETVGPEGTEAPAAKDGNAWTVDVGNISVNRLAFALEDQSVQPSAELGLTSLDFSIDNFSIEQGAVFPTRLSVVAKSGGTIEVQGETTILPSPSLNYQVQTSGLAIKGAQPYISSAADVSIDSGDLNITGQLLHNTNEPLSFTGDIDVLNFLITETEEGSKLGSWDRLGIEKMALSLAKNDLQISEIIFQKPYGDIVIAEDGSLNLGRIRKGEAAPDDAESEKAAIAAEPVDKADAMSVTIGRIVVDNGAANFADLSLPLPFAAKIEELNGDMSTIATQSSQPSTVALEGKVDEFGFVSITGHVTPLQLYLDTDLDVAFKNVEMPKFSAYTIAFAGREIASGKLDVDLGYKVEKNQLAGENKVVLREFELGDKVPHPGAMSLPLGLAVALLKDPEGKIDIDLPVRGDVSDPEFSYGGVVMKALANLIVKIVASPFALLGKLVGVEANDLEYIAFVAGRADLTPPEQEKAAKIAEALALRPELAMEVTGVIDRDVDGLAIRTARVDALVEERIEALAESDDMYAEQRRDVIEELYKEQYAGEDVRASLDAIELQFTTQVPTGDGDKTESQFDELAYVAQLRSELIAQQAIEESDMVALARSRAENARSAVVSHNAELADRVTMGQLTAVEAKDDAIQMKVTLSTR